MNSGVIEAVINSLITDHCTDQILASNGQYWRSW